MPSEQSIMRELVDSLLQEGVTPAEIRLALLIFRLTVLKGSADWTDPITPDEISARLNSVARSTVYGAISKLKARGLLDVSETEDGASCYRIRTPGMRASTRTKHKSRRKIKLSK